MFYPDLLWQLLQVCCDGWLTAHFLLLSRTPFGSPIGPWGLHSHKTALLPLLITTPESQESGSECRARRPSQCLWSRVHLGSGQVDLILTHLSLLGI